MGLEELPGVTVVGGIEPPTYEIPAGQWVSTLTTVRDDLGFTYFDFLTGVDELEDGFAIVVHVVRLDPPLEHVMLRTRVPRQAPALESASTVFAGAVWHERETHEMFGIAFEGHPGLAPLLLPDEFEGHPLRKEFVLASRVAKAWPGAKEPGESESHRAPSRRRVTPPGVPSAEEWGPREP